MSDPTPDPETTPVWEAQRLVLEARADAGLPDSLAFEEQLLEEGLDTHGNLRRTPSKEGRSFECCSP